MMEPDRQRRATGPPTTARPTDGPTDDGPTDDGPTDDGPTDDGLTSGGEDPLFLHGCGLESPCPAWDNYCDFDGCAAPTEASDCVFEALAASWSGTPAYIDIVMAAEASPNTIYALGDGTAIVERPFRECTLREASWFENCVGNDQLDECYGPWSFWDWDSCEEVAPYCPGA